MPSIRSIIQQLPEPRGERKKLVQDQNVYDIVRHVMSMHNECQSDYDTISERFWQGNDYDTAKYIFTFCKQNIPYIIEPAKAQTVKSPAAILRDAVNGTAGQDCKHYALFINGIIHSLERKGYPISCKYRFASDYKGEHYPKHVFSVMPTEKGDIWIDPVLPEFNQYHKYYYIKDKAPKMALYKVSGVGQPNNYYNDYISGFGGGDIGKHGKGRAKVNKFFAQAGQGLKTVGLAPNRNAFLLLLKVNFANMAVKLHNAIKSPDKYKQLHDTWHKIGGNGNKLNTAINQGVKHYNSHHSKKISGFGYEGSGYISAPQFAVILTEAAPVIAALANLLKSIGISTERTQLLSEAAKEGANILPAMEQGPGQNNAPYMEPGQDNKRYMQGKPDTYSDFEDMTTEPSPSIIKEAKTRQLLKQSEQEITNPTNALETTANVATDWGKGVREFVENNRGTVITLGGLTLGVIAVKYIFQPVKKRR